MNQEAADEGWMGMMERGYGWKRDTSKYIFLYHFDAIKIKQYHLFLPKSFNVNQSWEVNKRNGK